MCVVAWVYGGCRPRGRAQCWDMFDFSVGVGRPHHFSAPVHQTLSEASPPFKPFKTLSNNPWYEMKSTINFYVRAIQLIEKRNGQKKC